ncbi:MAG: heterodisulfide reductase-related iron-sulfur binding cluster [Candidatus Aminicenantales bacterium]
MLTTVEKLIFALLVLSTLVAFFHPVIRRLQIIRQGRPLFRRDNLACRVFRMLSLVLLQRCSLRNERVATGLVHAGLFYAALTFDTMTVNHTFEGFIANFSLFGHGGFAAAVSFLIDVMALIVLFATVYLGLRRFILRPQALRTSAADSAVIYFFLAATTLSYLFFEASQIAAFPELPRLSFLGPPLSRFLFGGAGGNIGFQVIARVSWWVHLIIVYAFIAYVPHSKYFHMFAGPVNLIFKRKESPAEIEPVDLEKAEIYGVEKVTDLTWKDLLDTFACIECGRCQDVCPAFASGKPLSPKMIIYNLERHLLHSYRQLRQGERKELPKLVPAIITPDEIWTCTTCGACMHVCPMEIEHLPKVFGLRQSQVLMESQFPAELNSFFRNLETNANPWGIGFARRAEWAEKEDVPRAAELNEVDLLLFVGCAGSFDEVGQAITRSLVRLLRQAGINFAILGEEEKCCGDAARRLGNEYLFQLLARQNLQLFAKYRVRRILVFCPHGYHTLKYEYPRLIPIFTDLSSSEREFLTTIEVLSHLELLNFLVKDGKLHFKESAQIITLHDSCYFGRHHQLTSEPRVLLKSVAGVKIKELRQHGEHSFCCGAGGGLMWTEEKIGERINRVRSRQVAQSGAEKVITTCPFCLTMIRDGLKDLGEENLRAVEISQFLASNLP